MKDATADRTHRPRTRRARGNRAGTSGKHRRSRCPNPTFVSASRCSLMTRPGIDPQAIGIEIRIGSAGRENAQTKSKRLLVEGRVLIRHCEQQHVRAVVRGDSGELRVVEYQSGHWSCSCIARGTCSHLLAVMAVTVGESVAAWSPGVGQEPGDVLLSPTHTPQNGHSRPVDDFDPPVLYPGHR